MLRKDAPNQQKNTDDIHVSLSNAGFWHIQSITIQNQTTPFVNYNITRAISA